MRAPFNTTVTLLDGPGTGTPFFPRVVGQPCRVIPDPYFTTVAQPDHLNTLYFTTSATVPNGPGQNNTAPDVWVNDYNLADVCTFEGLPDQFWQVTRVDLCTWPNNVAPYYQVHVREVDGPPPGCDTTYNETYPIFDNNTSTAVVLVRLGPYSWGAEGWFLDVFDIDPGAGCVGRWVVTSPDLTQWSLYPWNGHGNVSFTNPSGFLPVDVFGF